MAAGGYSDGTVLKQTADDLAAARAKIGALPRLPRESLTALLRVTLSLAGIAMEAATYPNPPVERGTNRLRLETLTALAAACAKTSSHPEGVQPNHGARSWPTSFRSPPGRPRCARSAQPSTRCSRRALHVREGEDELPEDLNAGAAFASAAAGEVDDAATDLVHQMAGLPTIPVHVGRDLVHSLCVAWQWVHEAEDGAWREALARADFEAEWQRYMARATTLHAATANLATVIAIVLERAAILPDAPAA